jgi:hypothetical protein
MDTATATATAAPQWPDETGVVPGTAHTCTHCGRALHKFFLKNPNKSQWVIGWTSLEEVASPHIEHSPSRCRDMLKTDLQTLKETVRDLDENDALQCDGPGHAETPCDVCCKCRARNLIQDKLGKSGNHQ